MNPRQQLLSYLDEIQRHIDDFRAAQIISKHRYQELIESFPDSKLASSLMEHHLVHTERQEVAIDRLEKLHQKIQTLLASLE